MRPVEVLASGITRALAALCPAKTDRLIRDLKQAAFDDLMRPLAEQDLLIDNTKTAAADDAATADTTPDQSHGERTTKS